MLVTRKLLSNINPHFKTISDQDFTSICNRVGIEVESIKRHYQTQNLSIGYIVEVEKHPQADRLNVAKVKLNDEKIVTVVCGATNIKANKYIIYAPLNTKMLDGRLIEKKDIRGIESSGMICGYEELTNIGTNFLHQNDTDVIILLDDATLGDTDIGKYIGTDDVIYDLSIPSNRNDLNAVNLLAHELNYGMQIKDDLNWDLAKLPNKSSDIKIQDNIANDIAFIHVKKAGKFSLSWAEKQILMSLGYKIQNNYLDLMNLFTISLGNPIHLYSAKKINLKDLSVRLTKQKLTVVALDDKTYEVPQNSIGIYCADELVNVAGIIGLNDTKYCDDDEEFIIEIANFKHELIRNTSQTMKVQTKAQAFFAKAFSGWITQNAFEYICKYLTSKKIKFECEYKFQELVTHTIKYDWDKMCKFIGYDQIIISNDISNILTRDTYHVHPSRLDIHNEFDVYEEILKLIDINKLPVKTLELSHQLNLNEEFHQIERVKQSLINFGFNETKTYNLVSYDSLSDFNFFNIKHDLKVLDPLSLQRQYLRVSLVDEMLKVLKYNQSHKRQLSNIFEFQPLNINAKQTFNNLTLVLSESIIMNSIVKAEVPLNYIVIKSLIQNLLGTINKKVEFVNQSLTVGGIYNTKAIAIKYQQQIIGYIAQITTRKLQSYDITKPVFLVTLCTDSILLHEPVRFIKPISNFPTVYRDINVVLKNINDINKAIDEMIKIDGVNECNVKDVYLNDSNQYIYTLTLMLNNMDNTLSSREIEIIMNQIQKLVLNF